jgi:hypothetical protein
VNIANVFDLDHIAIAITIDAKMFVGELASFGYAAVNVFSTYRVVEHWFV